MNQPLISCIMPTIPSRRDFVAQAIRYFNAQDYPNTELIIVDDGECDRVSDVVPAQSNIDYIYLDTLGTDHHLLTLGAKRNLAVSLARGEVICSWDDDDYYGPSRLSRQVAPLLSGEASASAFRMSLLLDARKGELWTCSDITHKLCFKQDIQYGTLMFQASYWHNGLHFANVTIGEDRRFVHALLAQDARIARIVDPASFAYVIHGGNTTSDMRLVHPEGWWPMTTEMEQYLPADALAFYQGLRGDA